MRMRDRQSDSGSRGSLAAWLVEQDLLRGPFLYTDYWASVLRFGGGELGERERAGLVDGPLFRLGIDRPDLELPRLRYYLILFFAGPLLLPFRFFRRLGRYRIRVRSGVGERVLEALSDFEIRLESTSVGRVNVRGPAAAGDSVIAEDVIEPLAVAGFSSLFLAAYKLPLAALTAILLVGVSTPALNSAGILESLGSRAIAIGFLLLVGLLYLVFRELVTALLGAVPVLIAALVYWSLELGTTRDWGAFGMWLAALFGVYLLIDLFFFPRPVPPALFLYTRDGEGAPYRRPDDAPWWLEGSAYWVWRYLMLTPAEINKFWERDWERVELWIRADGPDAGLLEWVVTDGHYRELWTPYERLGRGPALARCRANARTTMAADTSGTWLLEVDANLLFHTPFYRAVSFVADRGTVPARRVGHLVRSMWTRSREPDIEAALARLDEVKLARGPDVLDDLPELIADRAARHILSLPWTHWRYPLGANRRRDARVYERRGPADPLGAADPALQIKLNGGRNG
jgi:hypothetical protein